MKLHRLTLTNYRGVAHRDIDFPDRGVVVISGANEIGKSSMIEALDLLLMSKDRSTKKEVKAVKPTHADVGSEVIAEISTGPYRFIYRKRFHKRAETELTVLSPRREQLTGDEAHERVLAMLDETVDTALWQAQRVLQATATAPVDLSGCDALSRALDVAAGAGDNTGGTDSDPLLIDRIDAEYLTYFTQTGRPTGVWAAAIQRLRDADAEVAARAAAVAEVDDAVNRHAVLTTTVAELAAQRDAAQVRLAQAREVAAAVERLTAERDKAALVAAAAEAKRGGSAAAVAERDRLRGEIDERSFAAAELISVAAESARAQAAARDEHAAAEQAAIAGEAAAEGTRTRVEAARGAVAALAARDEAARLAGKLARIDAATGELERVGAELASISITDALLREVEAAERAVERAADRAELASAHVELVALADIELRSGDQTTVLAAGQQWSAGVAAPTDIEIAGVLSARVVPGADAVDTAAALDAARQALGEVLHRCDAADAATARTLHARRAACTATRDRLRATVDALTGDETVEQLRTRHRVLCEGGPHPDGDLDAARAELDAALTAARAADRDAQERRGLVARLATRLNEATVAASVLREKLGIAQAELTAAAERLAGERVVATDEALRQRAEADAEHARSAAAAVATLDAELAAAHPDLVTAALAEATAAAHAAERDRVAAATALADIATALRLYGTEGRKGALDTAESEREHAFSEYQRIERRARAAELLRSVMARHRESARLRYIEPFRGEIERLGRMVFGADFEVDIDSSLRICSRTVGGRTVGYESLSGGAKEQIGIVARLACASLVAKEDTVPVVIDDALGFSDPDRLTKMAAVFDAVGGDGQVIVLTCDPERYAGIADSHVIELSA
ncbi:AAA family ATPase [Mycolicibacterium fluoranthenivorans]|uniref:DNA repair exonuclease SbcCD ATPase subunit n=1 Tax=Mycolicibacterium fluoranthenivorans TaxID=258505 RepID=A0A1G4WZM7_9MYCO|nr:ATP-binding protein [Mycolicibacterium fluoranthenivorans]SCX33035.1 DNA repair exonuclease SbcCD ATPase subunit [Mycolicibacterium fluoranthenivorans]